MEMIIIINYNQKLVYSYRKQLNVNVIVNLLKSLINNLCI